MRGGATPYRKGAKYEREVAKWLRNQHYEVVRQPKSQSPYDLIAVKAVDDGHTVMLVQCKLAGRISRKEVDALVEVAREINANAVMAFGQPPVFIHYAT